MKITKTRKIQIAVCCIAVIAIACGTVCFLCNDAEHILDERVGNDELSVCGIMNLYSEVANKTQKLGSGLIYYDVDESEKEQIVDLASQIETVEQIEWIDRVGWYNLVTMEVSLPPAEELDCDVEYIKYRIALGEERETGYVHDGVSAEDGKKLVYVGIQRYNAYDEKGEKGAELREIIYGINPSVKLPSLTGIAKDGYIYLSADEEYGDQWQAGYLCQLNEEAYNALFDLQYNITKSALNIDK